MLIYFSTAFDAIAKQSGHKVDPKTSEKITDGLRGAYEKFTGLVHLVLSAIYLIPFIVSLSFCNTSGGPLVLHKCVNNQVKTKSDLSTCITHKDKNIRLTQTLCCSLIARKSTRNTPAKSTNQILHIHTFNIIYICVSTCVCGLCVWGESVWLTFSGSFSLCDGI